MSDAIDTEFFSPANSGLLFLQLSANPVVFLPARIGPGKGHHDLLQAARILFAPKCDLTLCFAGAVDSESLHRELRNFVDACGLKARVLFLGEVSAGEMREHYAGSSVVVLPNYSEGLSRVVLEAQAMKKPVVAYDTGGICEAMVSGETGFLLKTGDVKGLADRILSLLENQSERLRMGERGREFVARKFSPLRSFNATKFFI